MLFQHTITTTSSFKDWLWRDKENKIISWIVLLAAAISFIWLKMLYPYPNFMPPDSNNYLEAAYNNAFINIWPIGYSKFLQLVGIFSHSHLALVIVQYVILQLSLSFLLFTIRYLLAPGKWLFRIMLSISVLNPLLPHIANFVSSDCLFTALSILWFTQLLWIIYSSGRNVLITHAVVLSFAFMVRYNALYYPFISIAIIFFSSMPKANKRIGVGAIVMLLLLFIGRTQYEYYRKTSTVQYSAFGGWQIAANALYGYAHAKQVPATNLPDRYRALHTLVNQHLDSIRHLSARPDREVGIYYLWDFKSPLRVYMEHIWKGDTNSLFFKKWAFMAPLYSGYGRYLVLHHPVEFIEYYLWPNFQRYLAPPGFFMGIYNMGSSTVDPIAVSWFGLKSNTLKIHTDTAQKPVAEIFTVVTPVINLIFVTGFLSFIILGGFRQHDRKIKSLFCCILAIWISNAIFSVLSAPIELRYQLFPLSTSLIWATVFVGYIVQIVNTNPKIIMREHSNTPALNEV